MRKPPPVNLEFIIASVRETVYVIIYMLCGRCGVFYIITKIALACHSVSFCSHIISPSYICIFDQVKDTNRIDVKNILSVNNYGK